MRDIAVVLTMGDRPNDKVNGVIQYVFMLCPEKKDVSD